MRGHQLVVECDHLATLLSLYVMLDTFKAMEDRGVSDSLFSALRKYPKSQELDPIENFITEGFAWLLRNKEVLARDFINYLSPKLPELIPLTHIMPQWKTQHTFPGGKIDMVADFGQFALIFEHKIWSKLSDGQLDKYREYAKANLKWSQGYKLILITGLTSQHEQQPDLALTWSDIYKFLKRWLETKSDDSLVRDFIDMLAEENLGPAAPVSYESIVSYLPAQSLIPNLKSITLRAAEADWRWVLERIGFKQDAPILSNPVKYEDKYGRLVLNIVDSWFPGILIGTILDGSDCKVKPSNYHLVPDFCLILAFHIEKWKKFERDFFNSDEYNQLRSRLKANSGTWDFHDHRLEAGKQNPWHPLHLRKPLAEVFRGTITFDDQVERFIAQGREVIELLLEDGELEALTKRLHPIARNSMSPV
ncbi:MULTISPECIES: PD-(D/E)XK nuclease family protein [Calothrix]|uniref:PD-(D/E)XK nuclease family protein n=2 Tax=Calothrix TaxID=1186 RepID=A0ABR8ALE9_9CYAN|nr:MULTISPECIES: PD-(D/E)XK nuclease family protein [Calothrix]MBD2200634.1 PD-(D/E)XK nuclease family protein [Calothrix parietina FACHB-288]MBD2229679.1 PD-(D/E)XK nuclease family protein [Calothrix anomala FACHB-343]